ncbi:MAG: biopolymer transporter ExbD [Gemmataceae bacterium]|nr:biopolymer transporter ExbD [Gemmataceae bacterium]MDW8265857.1 biopolymer transporter ExbD [Gemmataceae bacterium]
MMRIVRRRRPPIGIDMSPLIDCVFQLLIFFMLSSSLLTPTIPLSLPQAATGEPPDDQEVLVTVDDQGRFFVNTHPIDPAQLVERLKPLVARSKSKAVTFRGDEKMPYELFIRAIDAARASGAVHVNIAHRPIGP